MKTKIYSTLILLSLIFIYSCNSSSSGSNGGSHFEQEPPRQLTEAELKEQLREKECDFGADYLDGTLSYKPIYKNLLSTKVNGIKLTVNITSKATLATYKDIKARVQFLSKTGSKVVEREFDIYEFVKPYGSIKYKTDIEVSNQEWKDISSTKWTILETSCN